MNKDQLVNASTITARFYEDDDNASPVEITGFKAGVTDYLNGTAPAILGANIANDFYAGYLKGYRLSE